MMFWQHSSEHGNRQTCSLRLRPSLPSLSLILELNLTFQLTNLLTAVLLALEKARKHPEKHSHKFKREGNSLRLTFMTHQIMAFFSSERGEENPEIELEKAKFFLSYSPRTVGEHRSFTFSWLLRFVVRSLLCVHPIECGNFFQSLSSTIKPLIRN